MPNWVKNVIFVKGEKATLQEMMEFLKGKDDAVDFNKLIPMPNEVNIVSGGNSNSALTIASYEDGQGVLPKNEQVLKALFYFGGATKHAFEEKYKSALKTFENGPQSEDISYLFDTVSSPKTLGDARLLGKIMLRNISLYGVKDWYDWCWENWGTKWNAHRSEVAFVDETEALISFETAWNFPKPVVAALVAKFSSLQFEGYFSDEDGGSYNHGHWRSNSLELDYCHDMSYTEIFKICWGYSPDN